MKELELPYEFPEKLFECIDQDGSGEITIDEFVDGAMSLTSDVNSRDMRTAVFQISLITNKMGKLETAVMALCSELGIAEETWGVARDQGSSHLRPGRSPRLRSPGTPLRRPREQRLLPYTSWELPLRELVCARRSCRRAPLGAHGPTGRLDLVMCGVGARGVSAVHPRFGALLRRELALPVR